MKTKTKKQKNIMSEEIYSHNINYWWDDCKERELNDTDREHISGLLKDNFNSGELCQSIFKDGKFVKDVYGWWEIKD